MCARPYVLQITLTKTSECKRRMRKKMFCLQTMVSVSASSMLNSAVTCWIVLYGVFVFFCISVRHSYIKQWENTFEHV